MSKFENKVALVTGGGSGIGKAIAERLVADGARVVVTGRRQQPLAALARQHPEVVAFTTADVAQPGQARAAVDFVRKQFGRLDLLVNAAGVYLNKPLAETADDELANVYRVNVHGMLTMCREALADLAKARGSIVNVSSTVSNAALPGHSVYSSTKAAVDHLTRTLAAELGPQQVRVNAVAPGLTETDMTRDMDGGMRQQMIAMTPLGRIGKPEDIASVVSFLASDDAAWVTGQVVAASGGLLL